MDIQAYYKDMRTNERKMKRELLEGKHPEQPALEKKLNMDEDEDQSVLDASITGALAIDWRSCSLYLVSVHMREKGTTAGAVHQAMFANAITRITDGTHQLATSEQIIKFNETQVANKKKSDAEQVKSTLQTVAFTNLDDINKIPIHLLPKPLAERVGEKEKHK